MKIKMLFYLILLLQISIYPKIWRVDVNSANKPDFTSLTEALNTINAGDTIYLAGGSYGNITINKKVTIIGVGYFLDQNPNVGLSGLSATIDKLVIDSSATGCVISSLQISSNSYIPLITIKADNVIISRCFITKSNSLGYHERLVQVEGDNCVLEKSYISFTAGSSNSYSLFIIGDGFTLSNSCVNSGFARISIGNGYIINNVLNCTLSITNSSFHNNIQTDLGVYSIITGEVTYNISHNNNLPDSSFFYNQNNVDMGTVFVGIGSYDGKYMLKDNSPAKGAGMGGTDCGMFGGDSPYVLSGVPSIPIIYYLDVPTTGTTTEGLPITIKIRSQK